MSVVYDHRNSFLVTKDQKLYTFKSFKRIFNAPTLRNVKFFKCFNNSCYAVVQQIGVEVKLLLYDSFSEEFDVSKCEFDLSFPQDEVTIGGCRDDEIICVEMIEDAIDVKFFNGLLACDLVEDSISDVLLVSIDEKLLWVKFSKKFKKGAIDDYAIVTVTVAKKKIIGLKYYEGLLMILDSQTTLTLLYLCPVTALIRKKEILLEGKVNCFRFHHNCVFIYSNSDKVIFMNLKNPMEPSTQRMELKGIMSFTIVDQPQPFIIGICCNRMFYYITIPSHLQQNSRRKDQFEELGGSDIEAIPEVARFLENGEKKLLEIEQKIKRVRMLQTLMKHLSSQNNFKAGEAIINFHRNIPATIPDGMIVCKVMNEKLGSEFIEVQMLLTKVLTQLDCLDIIFRRKGSGGIETKHLRVCGNGVHFLMPAKKNDDAKNKMSLEVRFTFDVEGKTRALTYPVSIKQVTPSAYAQICLRDSLDICLETVASMKM